jgi:initiation factor 1A
MLYFFYKNNMVKNTTGGSGHKSVARKLVASKSNNITRLAQEECERYACVTKILGNGMCNVTTEDSQTLLCHIRGKFKGRNKKNNIISSNSIVLIGLRDWESVIKNCDLIEVYSAEDVQQLRSRDSRRVEKLDKYVNKTFTSTTDDSLIFSNDEPVEIFQPPSDVMYEETEEDFIAFEDI